MQHLTEEQLVSHYYGDDEPQNVSQHLAACGDCFAQYETIRRVLALVAEAAVPDRGDEYGTELWNRLRWKLGRDRRRKAGWISGLAAAAALALAFFAGHFWRARHEVAPIVATARPSATAQPPDGGDRVLLLVVGDHLDSTERVLLEVANADPGRQLDIEKESRRAGELVAANRIYRQSATQNGNERIASVLADLEPVLIEISHAGATLSGTELAELQKRIEAKGLLFKVRVISAQTSNPKPRKDNDRESNRI
jgi:hypothetical protein